MVLGLEDEWEGVRVARKGLRLVQIDAPHARGCLLPAYTAQSLLLPTYVHRCSVRPCRWSVLHPPLPLPAHVHSSAGTNTARCLLPTLAHGRPGRRSLRPVEAKYSATDISLRGDGGRQHNEHTTVVERGDKAPCLGKAATNSRARHVGAVPQVNNDAMGWAGEQQSPRRVNAPPHDHHSSPQPISQQARNGAHNYQHRCFKPFANPTNQPTRIRTCIPAHLFTNPPVVEHGPP